MRDRRTPRHPLAAVRSLSLALTLGLVAAGCGGSEPAADPAADEPPDQTYTLRGEVVGLPEEGDEQRQLRVHHESLPDFVGFEGEVVGMASMTMPFPLADSVELEDVEEGDKVEMTFEVRWESSPPLQVVDLEELPADTQLRFESGETMPGEADVEGAGSAPP